MAVGVGAKHDAADGTNEVRQSERTEGQQQRNRRIAIGEKCLGKIDGKIAIRGDVVPFSAFPIETATTSLVKLFSREASESVAGADSAI